MPCIMQKGEICLSCCGFESFTVGTCETVIIYFLSQGALDAVKFSC